MTARIQSGKLEPVSIIVIGSTGVITGLTDVKLTFQRDIDGYYLDFDDNTYKNSGWTTREQVMSEVDATNSKGLYRHIGTAGNWTDAWDDGIYRARMESASKNFVADGELKIGEELDYLDASIQACTDISAMIQALCGKNSKLFNTTYDSNNNLTAGTIRGYANKTDLEADQNHIFELTLTATYSGEGKATEHIRKDST